MQWNPLRRRVAKIHKISNWLCWEMMRVLCFFFNSVLICLQSLSHLFTSVLAGKMFSSSSSSYPSKSSLSALLVVVIASDGVLLSSEHEGISASSKKSVCKSWLSI